MTQTLFAPLTQEEVVNTLLTMEWIYKEFGRNLTVKLKIDPQILGGLKIIVGDRMIDQTIAGKLSSLVEKIES